MGEVQAAPPMSIIDDFFVRCGLEPKARVDCHTFLENYFPGKPIEPARTQGYCSYTVLIDEYVVQFRPPSYRLSLEIFDVARSVHGVYVPVTTYIATMEPSGLLIYKMEKIQGVSYKDFRAMDYPHGSVARLTLCEDFATFIAQSWHLRDEIHLAPGLIGSSVRKRLEQLSQELPMRFIPVAKDIMFRMDDIEDQLPLVLAHGDIAPSNIMLNPTTGHLCGLVDWAEAEILPFGICLYGLEEILGYVADGKFVYHTDAKQARAAFWRQLQTKVPELSQQKTLKSVMFARDLGILLWYGFAFDDGAINRVVQEGKDVNEICYLDALLGHYRLI